MARVSGIPQRIHFRNRRLTAVGAAVLAAALLTSCGGGASDDPSPSPTTAPSLSPDSTPTPEPSETETEEPETEEPEPEYDIDSADSLTVVVNKARPLQPVDYVPETVPSTVYSVNGQPLRAEANDALAQMNADVTAATGSGFVLCSGYRSYDYQSELYAGYVNGYGQEAADATSARAGHSEHQLGLAADIMGDGQGCSLSEAYAQTESGQWVNEHAWEYGFILRYPDGSQPIVGYAYEPWHWRYVGVEIAQDMREQGITTLEEYFGLDAAPDYL